MKIEQGFTLIEMMITIVIAAILVSVGVPSFESVLKRNNIESLQMKLASAVSTARSEAASRNITVSMCSSNNTTACGGIWSDGWISFEDVDADGVLDATEIVIDVYEHDSNYTIAATNKSGATTGRLTFSPRGYMEGTEAALFTMCEPKKEVQYARGIFVSASGLMVKTRDSDDSDATHDNPFYASLGNPTDLTCP